VTEESSNVAEFVRVFSVDRCVELVEEFFKCRLPDLVELAEPFSHETVELGEGPFLRTTPHDHLAEELLFSPNQLGQHPVCGEAGKA
jgi:hypothetical protein